MGLYRSAVCAILTATLFSLNPHVSEAQSKPASSDSSEAEKLDSAKQHFNAGLEYFNASKYENAITEFETAYELARLPAILYNLSLCYERLAQPGKAAGYLEDFLEKEEKIDNRAQLEAKAANLRARQEKLDVEEAARERQLAEAEAAKQRLAEERKARKLREEKEGRLNIGAISSFAIAGVGLAAMTTFGIMAISRRNEVADSACGQSRTCNPSEISDMDTFALLSDVGMITTIVGASAGVLFLIFGGGGTNQNDMAFAPLVAPDFGGVSLIGRF